MRSSRGWSTVDGKWRGGRHVYREKRKDKESWTLTRKTRELSNMMERRKVDLLCVKETRWRRRKAN